MDVMAMYRNKFATYGKIIKVAGEQKAWDSLFAGYPERQKQHMGPLIDNATLAEGFTLAIPLYSQIGMDMQVIDISNNGTDGVLEIQRKCPVIAMAGEYGFKKPCHVICEMDVAATKEAFPGMRGNIIARIADGDCVCMFKYEREK
jgi:predicted ArsR family transcriptional regulator